MIDGYHPIMYNFPRQGLVIIHYHPPHSQLSQNELKIYSITITPIKISYHKIHSIQVCFNLPSSVCTTLKLPVQKQVCKVPTSSICLLSLHVYVCLSVSSIILSVFASVCLYVCKVPTSLIILSVCVSVCLSARSLVLFLIPHILNLPRTRLRRSKHASPSRNRSVRKRRKCTASESPKPRVKRSFS